MKKRIITNQIYESYWQITLEYSDFCGKPFNDVLRIIVDYIDTKVDKTLGITKENYQELQNIIMKVYPKSDISTRKSINQFFKLGFINNFGKSYHYLTRDFLNETDKEHKKLIYSKIVYDNASFSRSYNKASNVNEMQFLLKTLEVCGKITKDELLAVMFADIDSYPNGYLTPIELSAQLSKVLIDKTAERKYNQRNYLFSLCANLTDIYVNRNIMSLDPSIMIDNREKARVRDPYLQRLYKIELINEFKKNYKCDKGKCVMEHLAYPILIASHIKPYIQCENNKEAFDINNGLLLSKNMDSLFDNGYISFDDDGNVITSSKLDEDVAKYVRGFQLDAKTYNNKRRAYMQYHRNNVFVV